MIVLNQNKSNKVVLTLVEKKADFTGNRYLFEFRNDTSNAYFYCNIYDSSLTPDRYQLFYINCVASQDEVLNDYDIYLPLAGFYSYFVYEDDCIGCGAKPKDLNIVEVGKAYLKPLCIETPIYESSINPDLIVYDASKFKITQ